MKGPKRKNKNEAKKRVKPKNMNIDQRKNVIYHCVHKGCFVNQLQEQDGEEVSEEKKQSDKEKDGINRNGFKWMVNKLEGLCDLIGEASDALNDSLSDDIAIIPMDVNEFEFMENMYLKDLLLKLGYLAPNKYIGTCWWRIPRELLSNLVSNFLC